MNFEFVTIDTPLPPCMAFPRALTGFPVSSTAKVMYCRMLDAMLSKGQEDENGILFVCFPVTAIAAVLSRSSMTVSYTHLSVSMAFADDALFSRSKEDAHAVHLSLIHISSLCFSCASCVSARSFSARS